MTTSTAALKSIKELAIMPWNQGVPNPYQSTTSFSTNLAEALSYLEQIAQIAHRVKTQEGENFALLKSKCWQYAKQIKDSDEYLKVATICVDKLGTLSTDKPLMLLFKDNEPFMLHAYAKEYLERKSPYFAQLFSGWAKEAKSPYVEFSELSLNTFKQTLQQLDCSWLHQKLQLEEQEPITDEALFEVLKTADYLGLVLVHHKVAHQVIRRIQEWNPANLQQISLAQKLLAQSEDYAHHSEITKVLEQYMDKVSENLQTLLQNIEGWSPTTHLEDAIRLAESGICEQQPALVRALEKFALKLLETADDVEELSQSLEQLKSWPIERLTIPGELMVEEHVHLINQFNQLQCLTIQKRAEVENLVLLNHPSLSEIQFVECQRISKRVLDHLSSLSLTALTFDHCGIKDIHLSRLKSYKIYHLSLIGCPITPRGLGHLRFLPLTHLNITDCCPSSSGLSHLKYIKTLEHVSLKIHGLKDLSFLAGLSLKTLKLLHFDTSDLKNCAQQLKHLSIQNLILGGTWVTRSLLYFLRGIKIQALHIEECPQLYPDLESPFSPINWAAEPQVKILEAQNAPLGAKLVSLGQGLFASVTREGNGTAILWDHQGTQIRSFDLKWPEKIKTKQEQAKRGGRAHFSSSYEDHGLSYKGATKTSDGKLAIIYDHVLYSRCMGNKYEHYVDLYDHNGECQTCSWQPSHTPFIPPLEVITYNGYNSNFQLYPLKNTYARLEYDPNKKQDERDYIKSLTVFVENKERRLNTFIAADNEIYNFNNIIEIEDGKLVITYLSKADSHYTSKSKHRIWKEGSIIKEIDGNGSSVRSLKDGTFLLGDQIMDSNGKILGRYSLPSDAWEVEYAYFMMNGKLHDISGKCLQTLEGSHHIHVTDQILAGICNEGDNVKIKLWTFPRWSWEESSSA
ncbi:MAG: BTB/POZ domain-containing protein [Parachlamydiaceae bacterium]